MKFENFRELLLMKSQDPELDNIIHFIKDDVLADLVVESLEKMARAKHKGDAANLAIRDFGVEMDPELEPHMIHDALSHHASQYKAALGSGNQERANEHAGKFFKMMDLAEQAQKHSQGKLHVEAPSPHAWERNAKSRRFTSEDEPVKSGKKKEGQFVTDTKGWRYRGKDYSFLQQAPHEHYKGEVRRHGHNKAYPMEHVRVNGKYLDIKDEPLADTAAEHPFDKHPVLDHFEIPASKRTPKDDADWRSALQAYHGSPHMDRYFDRQDKMEQADPEAHASRGRYPSQPVHKEVTPLDISKPEESSAPAPDKPAAAAAERSKAVTRKKAENKETPESRLAMMEGPAGKALQAANPEAYQKMLADIHKDIAAKGGKNE